MEQEKKSDLTILKEKYEILKEKYTLPDFSYLNKEFQIEKISEIETDFLIKEIRGCITEKLFGYLRFIESILTPNDAPMFVFAITKTIGIKEREKLIELYKLISKLDIEIIELNLEYNEEKEIQTIKNYSAIWEKIKSDLLGIVNIIKKNWDNKLEDNGKSYFG